MSKNALEAPPQSIWKWKLAVADSPADFLWRAVRKVWAAFAIAAFPFLFILDAGIDAAFSPVLPGMIALIFVWVGAPYIHLEVTRKWPVKPERIMLFYQRSRIALVAACVWFTLWVVFG